MKIWMASLGHGKTNSKSPDHNIAPMFIRRRGAVSVTVIHDDSIPSLFLALTDTLNVSMLSTLNSIEVKS